MNKRILAPADHGPDSSSPETSGQFSFSFFSSAKDLPEEWQAAIPGNNLFLEPAYLGALEASPPDNMEFGYLLFYKRAEPVGVAVLQYLDFDAAGHIREQRPQDNKDGFKPSFSLKKILSRQLRYRLLVCGNMLLTGEHGFYFKPDAIRSDEIAPLLEKSLSWVAGHPADENRPVQAIMVKDIHADRSDFLRTFESRNFHRLAFDPNMILDIRREWDTFEGYLDSMTSKYRVRARRAFRKAEPITRKELSPEEVRRLEPQLFSLYGNIAESADFNMVALHRNYLSELKSGFPGNFRVFAYFLEEKIVGFFTTFRNNSELEAHFLGFDEEENRRYQLYLNMLYDIVWEGIAEKAERIIFSRTAMEIKSSVGAVAREMNILVRSNNCLFNYIVPTLIEYLKPSESWTPRHPFGQAGE